MKNPTFRTVNELASGPKLTLAMAQIDGSDLRRNIDRTLDGLRRVKSAKSGDLVLHFAGILKRADGDISGIAHYHSELKRVALGLSLVNVGDL